MEVGDYLTLVGELAIGVAGFSGVVAALTRRSADAWRPIDVLRFQMLIRQSVTAAMFAVLPALLLTSGVPDTVTWRIVAGAWLASIPLLVFRLTLSARNQVSAKPEDTSRALYAVVGAAPVASAALELVNLVALAAPWPHLVVLAISLFVAVSLFVRLATVAFSPEPPA